MVNPEKLEASEYKIVLPKVVKDQLLAFVAKGYFDLNGGIEDIPFEDLSSLDEEES